MPHFMQKCRTHGTVYGQCRCPDPSKTVQFVACDPKLCPPPSPGDSSCTGRTHYFQPLVQGGQPPSCYCGAVDIRTLHDVAEITLTEVTD
jgi:hypothetical protein